METFSSSYSMDYERRNEQIKRKFPKIYEESGIFSSDTRNEYTQKRLQHAPVVLAQVDYMLFLPPSELAEPFKEFSVTIAKE